jgi:hypothetical protein
VQFFAVGTSGTDFNIASATATHTFNLPTASSTNRGALSSADWSTFNSKQNALTNPVTGTGSAGQVAYWSSSSAITGESNLFWDATNDRLGIGTNSISNGTTFGGGGQINSLKLQSTNYTALEINGSTSGGSIQFTYGNNLPNQVAGLIGYNYSNGTVNEFAISNILNGSIIFSTQNAQAMRITSGGYLWLKGGISGFTGSQVDLQVPNGARIANQLILHNGANTAQSVNLSCIGASAFQVDGSITATSIIRSGGTSSQYLMADGSLSTLSNPVTGSGASGQVAYWSSGSAITGESNLFWDATNDRLGISVGIPSASLHIADASSATRIIVDNTSNAVAGSGIWMRSLSGASIVSNATVRTDNSGNFSIFNGTSTDTENLRIFSNGNVLIQSGGTFSNNGASFQVSGSSRFSGNVGIGVAPSYPLHISSNIQDFTAAIINTNVSDNAGLIIKAGVNSGNSVLRVQKGNGSELFVVDASGKVGIGTVSPNEKLEVENGFLSTYHNVNVNDAGYGVQFYTNGGGSKNSLAYISLSQVGTARSGNLLFGTSNSGAPSTKMTITSGGNLGIGVTPSAWSILVPAIQIGDRGGYIAAQNGENILRIGSNNFFNGSSFIYTTTGGASYFEIGNGEFKWFQAASEMAGNAVTFSQPMAINTSGNVGIGPSTISARLHVADASGATRIIVDNTANAAAGSGIYMRTLSGGSMVSNATLRTDNAGNFAIFTGTSSDTTRMTIASGGSVTINNLSGSGNRIVVANSGGTLISAVIGSGLAFDGTTLTATGGSSGSISGSGTSGTIALFTGTSSIGNSVITQSGSNIGIGTSSPSQALSIGNGTASRYIRVQGSVADSYFGSDGTGTFIGNGNNAPIYIVTDGIERMRITTGSTNSEVTFTNPTAYSTSNTYSLTYRSSTASFGIQPIANIIFDTVGDAASRIRFVTRANAPDYNTRMTIGAVGNVLINTTTDNGNRLRVNGTIFSDSSVTATSFFESSDARLKTLVEDDYQAKGIDSVVAKLYIKNGKQELGYFAQDLEGVLPSAVSKGSDGLLNLSYREVHTAKIAYLEEEIRQIKKRYEIN